MATRGVARAEIRRAYRWGNRFHLGLTAFLLLSGIVGRDPYAVGIGLAYFVFVEVMMRRMLADYSKDGTTETWGISADGVKLDLPSRSVAYGWDACRGVRLNDDFCVLRFRGMQNVGFPLNALTADQAETLGRVLQEHAPS